VFKASGLAAGIVRPLHSDNANRSSGANRPNPAQSSKSVFWNLRILPVFGNRSWFVHAGYLYLVD
jgi:hypothetical protein